MQNSKSGRSLAVRVGAFTAALSLMLAGGVALASSSTAAPNDNGNGAASQTKPKPNANPNNPQKNDPNATTGATDPTTGAGNNTTVDGQGQFGPSGSKNDAFEQGKKVWVCHADTNNGNAANAAAAANGGGNNLGQNGGGNTHAGFSIIYISWQAWLSNHDRLHENDRYFETEGAAWDYCGPKDETSDWYRCIAPGPVEQVNDVTSKPEGDGWIQGTAPDGLTCDGTPQDWYRCIAPGPVEQVNDVTSKPEGDGWILGTAPTGLTCNGGGDTEARMESPLCAVDGDAYVLTSKSASAKGKDITEATANATAALVAILNAEAKANPKSIIKPFGGFSANWTEGAGQQIFNDGCVLPPNVTVQSVSLASPATVAPAAGKPNPAKVQTPASATLPGSVPAGDGSSAPALPFWALAMVIVGAIGAAAAGSQLLGSRK